MFLHNLFYELKSSLRAKELIIWLMIFPIILGTFFKIAFGGLYDKQTKMDTIKTAVVGIENDPNFRTVIEQIEQEDEPLLKAEYLDEEKALEKLANGDITGVIYAGDDMSLTVSDTGIEQLILRVFIQQYSTKAGIIKETLESDPSKLGEVTKALMADASPNHAEPLTKGNTDFYIEYMYNLIAMVAMYGSITGLHIAVGNQANLSPLGARKCCSPTPKALSTLAGIIGSWLVQAVCMIICVSFTAFVLKTDYGKNLPYVYLAAILGGITGVSMGFFVGSIGRMKNSMKVAICMTGSMLCCFFSGLMMGNIKGWIAMKFPVFNNLNPAALVADSISSLNLYTGHERYFTKLLYMCGISAVFITLGLILTRRRKYADL